MKATICVILLTGLYACSSNSVVPLPDQFNTNRLQALIYNDSLLPGTSVAGIAGKPVQELKSHTEVLHRDSSQHSKLLSWPNGDIRTIITHDKKQLSLKAYSSLGVGFIRKISLSSFREQYESNDAAKKRIDALVKDKDTDPDIAIAEAKYLASQSTVQRFERMQEVGELAYWETPAQALHVFAKGYAFTITTNMKSSVESREKALAMARLIFINCSTY